MATSNTINAQSIIEQVRDKGELIIEVFSTDYTQVRSSLARVKNAMGENTWRLKSSTHPMGNESHQVGRVRIHLQRIDKASTVEINVCNVIDVDEEL
jgi:hypothetical protein